MLLQAALHCPMTRFFKWKGIKGRRTTALQIAMEETTAQSS